MRAVFLVLLNREIISYKVKRSFGVYDFWNNLNYKQFQCGISQKLTDDANWKREHNWVFYDEIDSRGKI